MVAVLLPDTQSSARYVSFDAPYLTQAFEAAGLSASDFSVQNAQGSSSTMQTQADAAITNGASVLVVDALDSGSGAAIEQDAKSKGVATIDYDRLTLNGSSSYYVSFDNKVVGETIGKGLEDCRYSAEPWIRDIDVPPRCSCTPTTNSFHRGANSSSHRRFRQR
jgi:D-xylose transport system substrate-binding protein